MSRGKIDDIRVAKLLIVPLLLPFVIVFDIAHRMFYEMEDFLFDLRCGLRDYIRAWRDL